ncbi:MAG: radical SAM protein [Anaerolineae bacterium]|nr:radical SAM protein [Anaerolineae bacterium]
MDHLTSAAAEVMRGHPCFSEEAHARVGRVHLPVAPRCNIQCAFCERRVCAQLGVQHPGWTREVTSPQAALERVRALVEAHPDERFVVGVAGPGEPLANEATFEALALVAEAFPWLTRCISTNGVLLEASLERLLARGVSALTVTINAPDADVGQTIYLWARDGKAILRGREAAAFIVARQLAGLRAALAAGLAVKVNTVLVPGVNDAHVARLAQRLGALGVRMMNLMPLIPGGRMADRRVPTREELHAAQAACEAFVPQFRACQHCSADVICFPTG